jgi:hypothetical protein
MRQFYLRGVHVPRFAALVSMLSVAGLAPAQAPHRGATMPASYERATTPDESNAASSVQFDRRMPQVGDQTEQTLDVSMQFDTVVRQGQEIFNRGKMSIKRHQRRQMTTTDVDAGMTLAVLVRYLQATKETAAGPTLEDLQSAEALPQPVQGKAYRCRREGEKLHVADEAGSIPPLDEYEVVAANMESLGRANPLAQYLAGRTVAVGDELVLPNDVAEKLLGLGEELGQVTRFALKLEDIRTIDGMRCAAFRASVDAASTDSTQMRLQVEGPLVVQVDTCRAVQACFSGPVGMSETRGSLTATYQMTATGRMHVDIASTYRDAAR